MQPSSGRTPSSILRKRGNKENAQRGNDGREGKKTRIRNRRVSFAPDDELETMHLYQKNGKADEEDMQLTPDLASRMPNAMQELNGPQDHADMPEASLYPVGMSMAMASPGDMSMSPVAMNLASNMYGLEPDGMYPSLEPTLPLLPEPLPTSASWPPPPSGYGHGLQPMQLAYTQNITSAVPALSTLIEEDEESQLPGSSPASHDYLAASNEDSPARHAAQSAWGAELTVDMELASPMGQPLTLDGDQPGQGELSDDMLLMSPPAEAHIQAGFDNDMTPTDTIRQMQALTGVGDQAPGDDNCPSEELLRGKWGYVPGGESTLDICGGPGLGDTTYNQVYGSNTVGDTTMAVQALMGAGGMPGTARLPRAMVAATANAAAASTYPHQHDYDGSSSAASRPAEPLAPGPAPPQPPPPGPPAAGEMTINLLADDGLTGMWRHATGPTGMSSSKPALHATEPPMHAIAARMGVAPAVSGASQAPLTLAGGSTTALLAPTGGLLLSLAGGAQGGAQGGSDTGAAAPAVQHTQHTRTGQNWTAQLLGEGATAGFGGPLLGFMQQMRGPGGAPMPPSGRAHATGVATSLAVALDAHGPRSQPLFEGTAGSLDFALAVGPTGIPVDDQAHTLDDFALPPELMTRSAMTPVRQARSHALVPPQSPAPGTWLATRAHGAETPFAGNPSVATPAYPDVAPISFQEFLGLVELKFLDDMRRRASLIHVAPSEAVRAGWARGGENGSTTTFTTSLMGYAPALEAQHLVSVMARVQAQQVMELAEQEESLRERLVDKEGALACDNPPLFKHVQMAGAEELEGVCDAMKALKRSCRQRTLLGWKKARIAHEQSVAGGRRDTLTTLDAEMAASQAAVEAVLQVEQRVDRAAAGVAVRGQHAKESAQAEALAAERERRVGARAGEVDSANTARAARLAQLAQEEAAIRAQVEAALQSQAQLQRTLRTLRGQATGLSNEPGGPPTGTPPTTSNMSPGAPSTVGPPAGRSLQRTPPREGGGPAGGLVTPMPAVARLAAGQPLLSPRPEGGPLVRAASVRCARLRRDLATMASLQGIQLDIRSVGASHPRGPSWSLTVQGCYQLEVSPIPPALSDQEEHMVTSPTAGWAAGTEPLGGGGADEETAVRVRVVATPQASAVARELLRCGVAGGEAGLTVKPHALLSTIQHHLPLLQGLARLAVRLEGALLDCQQLALVQLQPTSPATGGDKVAVDEAACKREPCLVGWEVVLGFVTCAGSGAWPSRIRVVVPLAEAMRPCGGTPPGRGPLPSLAVRVLQPVRCVLDLPGAGPPSVSVSTADVDVGARLGAFVREGVEAAVGGGVATWPAVCSMAVRGMGCLGRVSAGTSTGGAPMLLSGAAAFARGGSCAAAAVGGGASQVAAPSLINNPLFFA